MSEQQRIRFLQAELEKLKQEIREWKRRASEVKLCTMCGNVCV